MRRKRVLYLLYTITILLLISSVFNVRIYIKTKENQEKIDGMNEIIAKNVERNIRQSMGLIKSLMEDPMQETFENLKRTVQNLSDSFTQWVDLNQSKRRPNERMQRGISASEALRSSIANHLNTQYTNNDNKLSEYDLQMLERAYDNLDRLLLVYHNIEGRLAELKKSNKDDGGLDQISTRIEEMNRLYRHSITPNKHPEYISYEDAVKISNKHFPKLIKFKKTDENKVVMIREGVHYYQLNYEQSKENSYIIWVDAIDGTIRNYEYSGENKENREISTIEALNIARDFLSKFYQGETSEELFHMQNIAEKESVYSIRFIPIRSDVRILCDSYTINILQNGGAVLKFTNSFSNTQIPSYAGYRSENSITEQYAEELGNLEYKGLMVVRTFRTHFKPRITHSFMIVQNKQPMMIFFDVETGHIIHEKMYLYERIR